MFVSFAGGPTPRNLLQRIQNLEMRILELEGRSPEYFHKDVCSLSDFIVILINKLYFGDYRLPLRASPSPRGSPTQPSFPYPLDTQLT